MYNFNSMWWNYCNTSQRIDWMFGNGYWGTCFTGSINHKREIMILEKLKANQAIEAYPDGWTCITCGEEYTEETTDAKDFYAIHTEHGTECLKCVD